MNGCLIPNTPIAVDFWKVRECPHARIFLLTHLHGDHTTGLTSTWRYPIYCSEITGKLLMCRYEIKPHLIHTLELGSPQIVFLDRDHKEQMTLTALDANHCPGAVMFLLEGYFGTILHTGDFRFQPDMIQTKPLVDYAGKIDVLYLDNTYCSPSCQFPTRADATDRIIQIIESHPTYNVVFGLRSLGKENLLLTIAQHFQEYVSVSSQMFETLRILEAPDVFLVDSEECRFQVKPFHTVSNKLVARVNEVYPTIFILPTSLYCGIDARPYENQDRVFVVPYSDHSSYSELVQFVSYIRPGKIIPIVKGKSRGPFGMNVADRADMSQFQAYIKCGWNKHSDVPKTVKMHMLAVADANGNRHGKKRKLTTTNTAGTSKKKRRGVIFDSPSHSRTTEVNLQKENRNISIKPKHTKDLFSVSNIKMLSHSDRKKSNSPGGQNISRSFHSANRIKESIEEEIRGRDACLDDFRHDETIGPPVNASSPLEEIGRVSSTVKVREWLNSLDSTLETEVLNEVGNTSRSQNTPRGERKKVLSAYEIHRHLGPSGIHPMTRRSNHGTSSKALNGKSHVEMTKSTDIEICQNTDIEPVKENDIEKANDTNVKIVKQTDAEIDHVSDSGSDYFVIHASQGFQVHSKCDRIDESIAESCSNIDGIEDSPVKNALVKDMDKDLLDTVDGDGLERITDSFYMSFENEEKLSTKPTVTSKNLCKYSDKTLTVDQGQQTVESDKQYNTPIRVKKMSPGNWKIVKDSVDKFSRHLWQTKLKRAVNRTEEGLKRAHDTTATLNNVDIVSCSKTCDEFTVAERKEKMQSEQTGSAQHNTDDLKASYEIVNKNSDDSTVQKSSPQRLCNQLDMPKCVSPHTTKQTQQNFLDTNAFYRDIPRVECKKVPNAYEFHRHLEPSCSQPLKFHTRKKNKEAQERKSMYFKKAWMFRSLLYDKVSKYFPNKQSEHFHQDHTKVTMREDKENQTEAIEAVVIDVDDQTDEEPDVVDKLCSGNQDDNRSPKASEQNKTVVRSTVPDSLEVNLTRSTSTDKVVAETENDDNTDISILLGDSTVNDDVFENERSERDYYGFRDSNISLSDANETCEEVDNKPIWQNYIDKLEQLVEDMRRPPCMENVDQNVDTCVLTGIEQIGNHGMQNENISDVFCVKERNLSAKINPFGAKFSDKN